MAPQKPKSTDPVYLAQLSFFQSYLQRAQSSSPKGDPNATHRFPFCSPSRRQSLSQSPGTGSASSPSHATSHTPTPSKREIFPVQSISVPQRLQSPVIGCSGQGEQAADALRDTQDQVTDSPNEEAHVQHDPSKNHVMSKSPQRDHMAAKSLSREDSEVSMPSAQSRYFTPSPGEPPLKRMKSGSPEEESIYHDAREVSTQQAEETSRSFGRSSSVLSPPPASLQTPPAASASTPATTAQATSTISRRVVKNSQSGDEEEDGSNLDENAAANSDDSDSSLPSLNELFSQIRKNTNPEEDKQRRTRSKTKQNNKNAIMDRFLQPPRPQAETDYLKTLESLQAEQLRDQQLDREIDLAQSKAHGLEEETGVGDSELAGEDLDKSLLESVVKGEGDEDGDKLGKVYKAIDRVDAFGSSMGWKAIAGIDKLPRTKIPEFPESCRGIPPFDDGSIGSAATWRELAFLCSKVRVSKLPEFAQYELLEWLLRAACAQPDTVQAYSMMSLLRSYGHGVQMLCSPERMTSLFGDIGVTRAALESSDSLIPHKIRRDESNSTAMATAYSRLTPVFNLIENVAAGIDDTCRTFILGVLFRLGADKELTQQPRVLAASQRALAKLVNSTSDKELAPMMFDLSHSLYHSVKHANLQQQLLAAIAPAQSRHLHIFRRRLALAFLLETPDVLKLWSNQSKNDVSDENLVSRMVDHLRSHPTFDVFANDADYTTLTASVSILDMAIGNGFGAPTVLSTESESKGEYRKSEQRFNSAVDELVNCIEGIAARIMDSGATHMSRSDAKVALLRLSFRLQHTVRTKVKPRQKVFAPDDFTGVSHAKGIGLFDLSHQKESQQNFMKSFLNKKDGEQRRTVSFKLSDDHD